MAARPWPAFCLCLAPALRPSSPRPRRRPIGSVGYLNIAQPAANLLVLRVGQWPVLPLVLHPVLLAMQELPWRSDLRPVGCPWTGGELCDEELHHEAEEGSGSCGIKGGDVDGVADTDGSLSSCVNCVVMQAVLVLQLRYVLNCPCVPKALYHENEGWSFLGPAWKEQHTASILGYCFWYAFVLVTVVMSCLASNQPNPHQKGISLANPKNICRTRTKYSQALRWF